MSNSLYLKYRPQNFDEVIGQDVAKKILMNSILENKINHAYLFFGIRGTGKTTLARIFAKAINCEHRNGANPCGTCKSCKEIAACAAMDVIEIDAASNNGVDEIRNLTEKTNYFSTSLKYKVYIIDEVHMLSKSAFNALLKTLEEPPENTVFLLATTEINKIPETILSRTIIINLEILSTASILKGIKFILEQEKIDYDEKALKYIVLVAGGSLRDAITAIETVLLYNKDLNVDNVVKALGLIKYEDIENLLKTNILKLADLINSTDNDPKKIIQVLIEVITNLVRKGQGEYKPLLSDILNIFISIKDPSLIKISLYSLLTSYTKDSDIVNVSRETNKEELSNKEESIVQEKEPIIIKEEQTIITLLTVADDKKEEEITDEKSADDEVAEEAIIEVIKEENIESEVANVPRETLENNNKEQHLINDPNEIVNKSLYNVISDYLTAESYITILFEADDKLLEKIKKRWEFVATYSSNEKYKPFINIMLGATPLVVNKQALILGLENDKDINELKRISLDKDFLNFIDDLLGKELLVLPVNPNNWSKMLKVHKQLVKKGTIIKKPIIIPQKILKADDTNEMILKKLFGDKIEYE